MKNFFYLSLLLIGILYSCNNEETLDDQTLLENSDFAVINGMLSFKDTNSFSKQITILHEMSREERENWLNEINFNNSLYSKTKGLLLEEIKQNKMIDVPDEVFASILNSKGEFSVGEEVHKITQKDELVMSKSNFIQNSGNWDDVAVVDKIEIVYGQSDYGNPNILGREILHKTEPYDGDFFLQSNPSQRANLGVKHLSAHLSAWHRNYALYSSAGIQIKGRKKKKRKWKNDEMWYAAFNYTATEGNNTKSGFGEGNKVKSIGRAIFYKTVLDGKIQNLRISADFIYEDDGYPRVVSPRNAYSFNF